MNRFFKGVASVSLVGSVGTAIPGSFGCAKGDSAVFRCALYLESGKEFVKATRSLLDNFNDFTKEKFKVALFNFLPLLKWADKVHSREKDENMLNKVNSAAETLGLLMERDIPEIYGHGVLKAPAVIKDFIESCEKEYLASHPEK